MSTPQHSLTAPADRVANPASTTYNLGVTLAEDEVKSAMAELNVDAFVRRFPKIEKFYADPPLTNQLYSLVSFVPAKGATPDRDGVFGMLKVRGTFASEDEAMLRAEYLVRNVDSYHSIYHTYVGRPFPLAASAKYITDQEKQMVKEIEEREKELVADVEKKDDDPYDLYTELQVKKAQLSWTYSETLKKMNDMKESIIRARSEIKKMDEENADYREQYMEKYRAARKKSGLPETDNSFMKYMGEDLDVGF